MQPFRELQVGMAGYEPFQEGLAVLAEYLVGELDAQRLRQLAGRVRAVQSVTAGAGFADTFRELHRDWGFPPHAAFTIAMRVHRGGGYTKDAVYLRGLHDLLGRLRAGARLEDWYVGKIAAPWLPLVEELRWRNIVKPPALLPRFLQDPEAARRLERLRAGLRVPDLLERTD
jgi:uncharacterized protein (TIGR02421 family)